MILMKNSQQQLKDNLSERNYVEDEHCESQCKDFLRNIEIGFLRLSEADKF